MIDDLGDAADGDRTALLTEFGRDLATAWDGGQPDHPAPDHPVPDHPVPDHPVPDHPVPDHPVPDHPVPDHPAPDHPVLRRLVPTVRARGLDREPFERLIRANLLDQHVHRYATYADLRGYCELSAEPIGRIVLAVFAVGDPAAIELSDRICTALQLIEHWQDIAEDRRAGRVYLPQEDLTAFGVPETDLDASVASPALRRLMAFQITRAADLLDSGAPLVGLLTGWARLAVAGYLAGGRAALAALRRPHTEFLTAPPRPHRRDVLRHLLAALREAQSPEAQSPEAQSPDPYAPELDSRAVATASQQPCCRVREGESRPGCGTPGVSGRD
ncbi:MAG: squalene/phytoene synthase family protein [Pseudonocardiaceae bacterium]